MISLDLLGVEVPVVVQLSYTRVHFSSLILYPTIVVQG